MAGKLVDLKNWKRNHHNPVLMAENIYERLANTMHVVNVMEAGCIGNGTHDDTDAAQEAITAAAGGICFFPTPPTNYLVDTTLDISANTTVLGSGYNCLIKADADFGDNPIFRNTTTEPANDAARDSGIVIENLRIDGNRSNNSTGTSQSHGISLVAVVDSAVRNCWINSPKGDGIYLGIYTTGPRLLNEVWVEGNYVYDAYRNGIAATGGIRLNFNRNIINTTAAYHGIDIEPDGDYETKDISITQNIIYNSFRSGIALGLVNVTTAANKRNFLVANNIISSPSDATYGRGIFLYSSGSPTSVVGNQIFDAGIQGILVDANSHDVALRGNTVYKADGIGIDFRGDRFTISGNHVVADAAHAYNGNTADGGTFDGNVGYITGNFYGLELTSTNDMMISNNFFRGDGTGASHGIGIRSYSGANSLISGNRVTNFTDGIVLSATAGQTEWLGENHVEGNGTDVTDSRTVSAASPTTNAWGWDQFDTTSNAIATTLGSGQYVGQIKGFVLKTRPGANNAVLTVTSHLDGDGGTYTFDAVGETALLCWMGTDWMEIKVEGTSYVP